MPVTPRYLSLAPVSKSTDSVEDFTEADHGSEDQKDKGTANPIFNFNQTFINNLQSISAVELGQSVPYVRLRTIDHNTGEVIDDLNIQFFHKTLDMDTIKDSKRFTDRPDMSLKELTISTDQASGYLYYTNVTMRIKLHNPEKLEDNTLLSFLVPAAPLLLEYGWNSPNDFLNRKSNLLWQVQSYNLNFDVTGQVDITVIGKAFNETFNNIYVGDDGTAITIGQSKEGDLDKTTVSEETPEEVQFSNLGLLKRRLDRLSKFLKDNKKKRQKVANYGIVQSLYEDLQKVERRQRGQLAKKFADLKKNLKEKGYVEKKWGKGPVACWTFHDIIYTLCNNTFEKMTSVFHPVPEKTREDPDIKPTAPELRIIYGKFNPNSGHFAGKSIADFPIPKKRFNSWLKKKRRNGQWVPTVGGLMNMMIRNFCENPELHRAGLSKKDRKGFKKPDVTVNVTNRGNVIEVQIVDINQDFPLTSAELTKKNVKPNDILNSMRKKMPVILLGNAGSFIKNLNMSQISDQYMKAVLIERMNRDRIYDLRSTVVPAKGLGESTVTPLTLPLRGTMNVLGHVDWKPFRAFYLSTGVYIIDAVYKILKVSHKISAEGFNTNIEFMYH
jgi:hypothetical protein